MRLWHKDLIEVLPNQQLKSQWRELLAIKRKIDKCFTPNHLLVNYVLDIRIEDWILYSQSVYNEMKFRGYKVDPKVYEEIRKIKISGTSTLSHYHTAEYLKICYYNLLEKYIRGGFPQTEWKKVNTKYHNLQLKGELHKWTRKTNLLKTLN